MSKSKKPSKAIPPKKDVSTKTVLLVGGPADGESVELSGPNLHADEVLFDERHVYKVEGTVARYGGLVDLGDEAVEGDESAAPSHAIDPTAGAVPLDDAPTPPEGVQPIDEETQARMDAALSGVRDEDETPTLVEPTPTLTPAGSEPAPKQGSLEDFVARRWPKQPADVRKRLVSYYEAHREQIESEGEAAWGALPNGLASALGEG